MSKLRRASNRRNSSRIATLAEPLERRFLLAAGPRWTPRFPTGPEPMNRDDDHVMIDREGVNLDGEYQLGGRWTSTASGSTGSTGSGMTLTYSIAPDGLSIPGSNGEPTSANVFTARMNAIYGSSAVWLPIVHQVFEAWSAVSGITYVYQPTDDGAAWFSNGQLGVRGDVRISSHPIDGAFNVLAYNFFPNGGGDMVIDSNDLQSGGYMFNTSGNSLRLRNVMAHEHGHGLGFSHVDPTSQTKLMEPFASTNFDGVQFDDMLAVQRNYGDFYEKSGGNNSAVTATNRGTLGNGTDTISNVSTATTSDQDWYKFTVTEGKIANITLAVVGNSYLQGPQGGATSTFNPKTQADLQLQLIASDGTTVLATSNNTGLGGNEGFTNLGINTGTYYLKVSDVPGTTNNVQPYQLSINLVSGGVVGTLSTIAPDPRTTPVTSVGISFNEPVTGFDPDDLLITRDGFGESLAGASLNTSDNQSFTLTIPAANTDRVGRFTISFKTSGTGIVGTVSGKPLAIGANTTWTMQGLNGTGANETIKLKVNAGDSSLADVFINSATPSYSFLISNLSQLVADGAGGDDTFVLDFSDGSPLPAGANGFNGGAGGYDAMQIIGASGSDAFTLNGSNFTRTSGAVTFSQTNFEALDLKAGQFNFAGNLNGPDLTLRSGISATINSSQYLGALVIEANLPVIMPANGNRLLSLKSLSMDPTSGIDMFDNDLLLDYDGPSQLAAIQALINAGRNGGLWNGTSGLQSTSARVSAQSNKTLGAMEGFEYLAVNGPTFDGVAVDNTAVVVKYTYYGDTDFNGRVNFDDYARIDFGFSQGRTGWTNGDFNANGVVNFDDYSLIDLAFNTQGGVVL